jgi:hypothetical protein
MTIYYFLYLAGDFLASSLSPDYFDWSRLENITGSRGYKICITMSFISFDAEQLWVLDSVSGEVKIDGSEVELVLQTLASTSSSLPSCK